MGRGTDRYGVASAQVSGTADACAQHRRLTPEQALAEIREVLAGLPQHRRQGVLDAAAARYARPSGEEDWYFADSFALIVQAGADPHRADEIRATRSTARGLAGLGEGGGSDLGHTRR